MLYITITFMIVLFIEIDLFSTLYTKLKTAISMKYDA